MLTVCYFIILVFFFFFSSRRRHTRCSRDLSSDVCSSDLAQREHDAVPRFGPEAYGADLNAVGPTHFDVLEEIPPRGPGRDLPTAPVQRVRDPDGRPDDRRAVLAGHPSLNRGARDALSRQEPRQKCEDQGQKAVLHFSPPTSLRKRGLPRRGSQSGSMRSQAGVSQPGIERRYSRRLTAASYSPTMV